MNMVNREFIEGFAARMNLSAVETQRLVHALVESMTEMLESGNEVNVQGFVSFEKKKKNERVIVHPSTGKKILVPPKLVVGFKQSNVLKSQVKESKLQES